MYTLIRKSPRCLVWYVIKGIFICVYLTSDRVWLQLGRFFGPNYLLEHCIGARTHWSECRDSCCQTEVSVKTSRQIGSHKTYTRFNEVCQLGYIYQREEHQSLFNHCSLSTFPLIYTHNSFQQNKETNKKSDEMNNWGRRNEQSDFTSTISLSLLKFS